MGYIYKLIDLIGKHRTFTAFVMLSLFVGGFALSEYKYNKKSLTSEVGFEIAKTKLNFLGFTGLDYYFDKPPVANINIDTPQKKWIVGNLIVFNASESNDDKMIARYEWVVDGKKIVSGRPAFMVQSFDEGFHNIELTVYDEEGKSAKKSIDVEVKEKPFDHYDGIRIIGNEEFQKDVIMSLEFAKKYSLLDYEFIKKNTKEIESAYTVASLPVSLMRAGSGYTYVNPKYLRNAVANRSFPGIIVTFAHEAGHSYADFNQDIINSIPNYNPEIFAGKFAVSAANNLSYLYLNQSDGTMSDWGRPTVEIDKFYTEFDFLQFEN